MFVPGRTYIRRKLHEEYAGQEQGGISTPRDHPFIMLFTGPQGSEYGYEDGWAPDGIFFYTGEGQVGHMNFVRGNRAVRDHVKERKSLQLFEYVERGHVRYVGEFVSQGHHLEDAPDRNGTMRKVIVFELCPLESFALKPSEEAQAQDADLMLLRERALGYSASGESPGERYLDVHERSRAVRDYVLMRAGSHCEACEAEAPFVTPSGRLYLECHHIHRLSDGGPDHPDWVIGVCPNCHARAHYGENIHDMNQSMKELVGEIEERIQQSYENRGKQNE